MGPTVSDPAARTARQGGVYVGTLLAVTLAIAEAIQHGAGHVPYENNKE